MLETADQQIKRLSHRSDVGGDIYGLCDEQERNEVEHKPLGTEFFGVGGYTFTGERRRARSAMPPPAVHGCSPSVTLRMARELARLSGAGAASRNAPSWHWLLAPHAIIRIHQGAGRASCAATAKIECPFDMDGALYFSERDRIERRRTKPRMATWRRILFSFLYRNSVHPSDHFNLPPINYVPITRARQI
jgi:hypothetical protein